MKPTILSTLILTSFMLTTVIPLLAASGTITIDASKPGHKVSPSLYGIFLEEINNAVEGGLYAELIQNRGFEDSQLPPACTLQGDKLIPPRTPHYWIQPRISDWTMPWPDRGQWPAWSPVGSVKLKLVDDKPLNKATPHSLQITIESQGAGVANEGFWGMNIVKGENYRLRFHARSADGFLGPFTALLEGSDGRTLAKSIVNDIPGADWKEYNVLLKATDSDPKAHFVLTFGSTGTVWLDWVSLMPTKVWKNKPYNLRPDIAQMIADMKPAFIRWPGGCYVEGITVEAAPNWKRTIGPIEERPGTFSPWGYWSTDSFGYHEWLQFCEDIGADALYVVNCGVSCAFRSGTFIPDDKIPELIQDTLDAIEYAIGPTTSRWGKVRAKNGHPKPFPLKYIEIGNEEQGPRYGERWARFYKAIKEKYPNLQVILSSWIAGIDYGAINAAGKIDIVDEHAYKSVNWPMENWNSFEAYNRGDWDLYIGEFACNGGVGRGNLMAALGDSLFMMMMEKNSDLIKMGSYAPLLENVNRRQWEVNLIHYNSSQVFGRASYYACKLFGENRYDVNLKTDVEYTPDTLKTIGGGIGLGTFNTAAEFKDIKVEQNGKVVYKTGLNIGADEWRKESESWQVVDGVLRQTQKIVSFAFLDNADWKDITISCKARKLEGSEGFIILAGYDDGRRICWNVGGWGNSQHVIQVDGSIVGTPMKASVESNRWYDLRMEVKGRTVRCYLDGQLTNESIIPRLDNIFAIAGRDEKKGEIVIKVVNTCPEIVTTDININGAQIASTGDLILLTSENPNDENSFENPTKISPKTAKIPVGNSFKHSFPPYSLSIIRIKTK